VSTLSTVVLHDARLQYRYGIYAAYAFVIAFYILVLTLGRGLLPEWGVGLVIYTDPAAVGFFFLGALVMLEKGEGVRAALAVTPLKASTYLAAKAVTLGSISVGACAVLIIVHGGVANPALLLLAVALSSLAFIGLGIPIALRFRTVNGYLVGSAGFLTPLIALAGLALVDPMPVWMAIWPPVAQFRLVLVATGYGSASLAEIVFMIAISAAAAAAMLVWATASLRKELGK
jgi:fluoroquinolone transport system permease protein